MSFPQVTDVVNAIFGTAWSLPIPTFGIMVAIAIVVATGVARRAVQGYESLGKLPSHSAAIVANLALVSALAGIVGARVFHVLDHADEFMTDPFAMILTRSGFSIYGGLCFGIVAGVMFVRRHSLPVTPTLDAAAPAMMLGYAIGRLGCQIAGDGDWGTAADMALKPGWLPDWLWAQTYEGNIAGVAIAPPGVYPAPMYESLAALAIFLVLWCLRSHENRAGYLFSLYLLLSGFERILIEKIRINARYDLFGTYITQAEAISVLLIVAGFIGVLATLRTKRSWTKIVFSVGVLSALSACVPL